VPLYSLLVAAAAAAEHLLPPHLQSAAQLALHPYRVARRASGAVGRHRALIVAEEVAPNLVVV
jgi:hypothetical protein